ncbi:hypothetical protein Lmac_1595 [Legionella maceachernii]|uniref:Uncharacterized protein n=2 Tax=Legionella maceachernii TaxID=466 RepID=A0A0W0W063_9GAMM|nr:hypothetical protein Lmac_1595 [Legionella maceachernii]SJZ46343.1 hypothetical protein SAMN02745128_00099 [Legionella maceachernii]SUP04008.1 Uncharacterised protein [Legionella maceachernii]
MKKFTLLIALLGISVLMNGSFAGIAQIQEKLQLAIAINNPGGSVGTDKATTSFPNAGMNTTPTKQIGTDSYVINPNAPSTKPGYGAGTVWPTAPAYTPQPHQPASSSATH